MAELFSFLRGTQVMAPFSDAEVKDLAESCRTWTGQAGETLFEQGSSGPGLYIIQKGSIRLFEERDGVEQSIGIRTEAETVGEIGALRDVPLEYSARAAAETQVVILTREQLCTVMSRNRDAEKFLTQYVVLAGTGKFIERFLHMQQKLSREELSRVINSIGLKKISAGETILSQDQSEDQRLYVIQHGLVRIERVLRDDNFTIDLLGNEEIFGEKACLEQCSQAESAVAARDTVVFILPRDTVNFLIERNPSLKALLRARMEQRDHELIRQQRLLRRRRSRRLTDILAPRGLGSKVLRNFVMVEQQDDHDSGAAAVAMVCKHYHIPITHSKIRQMLEAGGKAVSPDALARIGENLGFNCKSLQSNMEMIQTFDLPFVVLWQGYRYVVVYGISRKKIWIADPAEGFIEMSIAEFTGGWDGTTLVFIPTEAVDGGEELSENPWLRFVRFLVPNRGMVRDIVLSTMIMELLGLVSPLLTQAIVDKVVVHSNLGLLNLLVIGAFVALLFTNGTRMLRSYFINFLIRRMDFSMMSQFYKHMLSLPVSFFSRRKVGDILACFNENEKIREFLTYTALNAILNVFMLVVYLGVMLMFNVHLSLIFVAFIPPLVLLTAYATPRYAANARTNFFAQADAKGVLNESLNAAETIKALGLELPLRVKWEKKYAKALNISYKAELFASCIRSLSRILNGALVLTILWYGARLVIAREMSVGQLMAFCQIVGSVMAPLMALIDTWNQFYEAGVSIERIVEVLDIDAEQKPAEFSERIILPRLKGNVCFNNVGFRYGSNESPWVLRDISFRLKEGNTYALVGAGGAGKTSLARLLVGLYPCSEGTISVDGHDIMGIDINAYRLQIGYVMQANSVFAGTLSENIALGDSEPDYKRAAEVAHIAMLDDLTRGNPLGLEFKIGERGSGISGGQIQRLCLARALYHDPRLLVLDEATASLDSETEEEIFHRMEPMLRTRTCLIIAHRLATILRADQIFVLSDGTIAESGTHDELLARRGVYCQLMKGQLGI